MRNSKSWYSISCFIGFVLLLSACNDADTEVEGGSNGESETEGEETVIAGDAEQVFRLTHTTPESHMWHQAAVHFGDILAERSDGRFGLEIYPAGQLGTEADMLQQIESGSIDFGFITAAEMSSREEAFSAWFAPYLFDTILEANEARESNEASAILNTLDSSNMIGLDYLFAGQRMMLSRDVKIEGPDDMSGLTLRVTPSPPMLQFYNSLGASTEGIPLPEVYSAAQTGVIDGMDMDLDATITNNFYEVVDYAAVTNHMVWPAVAVMNDALFDGLSDEDQQIVIDALDEAADFSAETRYEQEEEFKEQLRGEGMDVYDIDQTPFESEIAEFDEEYSAIDSLIEDFITAFR
ncbi:TRAP transporter substrate-binding protein [Geomicrobium sp. JCM 19039]|uniref:TRAP transporter substrate-binding protein n=1 Tax=Geomicrobium sp. JCM 19039 TaxID=1460636 RepID=UPI0005AB3397|nr:TRAP transporter substrate-binding protein [Geomicrobium sp. JCM 19039]